MADTELDTSKPLSTESPTGADDQIRNLKTALQERLDVDHYFEKTGTVVATETNGGGKHRQVTFYGVLGSDPTPASGEGLFYTKTTGGNSEVFYIADGVSAKQLTSDGKFYIVKADILSLIDAETLYWDTNDKIAVQLDNATLEYDAANKVQIKVPAATGDDDGLVAPVMAHGHYTGDGSASRQFDTGINIRHLVLRRDASGYAGIHVLFRSGSQIAWFDTNGTDASPYITISGTTFTVTSHAHFNANGASYMWYAIGERP